MNQIKITANGATDHFIELKDPEGVTLYRMFMQWDHPGLTTIIHNWVHDGIQPPRHLLYPR